MMTPSRSRKKMAHAPAWCRKVTDPSADLLCALADWRRRAFRVGLGRYISRATLPHPALAAGKTENRRSFGNRPRPSVRSSDTTGPSSVSCRARVGRCGPGPAHCVVASRRALGPHLVKSRMPKNSAAPGGRRVTCSLRQSKLRDNGKMWFSLTELESSRESGNKSPRGEGPGPSKRRVKIL